MVMRRIHRVEEAWAAERRHAKRMLRVVNKKKKKNLVEYLKWLLSKV